LRLAAILNDALKPIRFADERVERHRVQLQREEPADEHKRG
jgi:hypothetical protein